MKTSPVTTLVEQNSIEAFCSHSSANVPIVGRKERSFQTSLTKTYLQGGAEKRLILHSVLSMVGRELTGFASLTPPKDALLADISINTK